MSSIRLFILSSFADLGPMHGHRLRLEAERKHVHLWTDITVGAVYGAMNRLAAEGLLQAVGSERAGNRPARQLFEITDQGRAALDELRRTGLSDVWFKVDPFDLALTRMDPQTLDDLPSVLADRLDRARSLLAESRRTHQQIRRDIGVAEDWALRHTEYRLAAEVAYLTDLAAAAPSVITEARTRSSADASDADV